VATYREIQADVKLTSGFVPKTCWIAHVLSDHGLTTRTASNRISEGKPEHPCPAEKRPPIEAALRRLKVL
jgi:hypothetical protein